MMGWRLCALLDANGQTFGGCHHPLPMHHGDVFHVCLIAAWWVSFPSLPFFFPLSFFFSLPPFLHFSLCLISHRRLTKGQPLPRQWGFCCSCFPGALFPFPPSLWPSSYAYGDPSKGTGLGCLGRDGEAQSPGTTRALVVMVVSERVNPLAILSPSSDS